MEQHYVFLKNNRVENIAVFSSQDEQLADAVAREHGFDDAVWVGENKPVKWSTYDGVTFTPPTDDYLISIGIINLPIINVEEVEPTPAIETPTE